MKTFSRSTLGLVAVLTLVSAAGMVKAQSQPVPSSSATAATKDALPANVQPTSPLAQVIHLVQAGIDEPIIQSYITNSSSTFNLDSDKIIFLTDIGAPNDLVTLMMQKDQSIQQQIATTPTPPPTEPTTTPDSAASYVSSEPAPATSDLAAPAPPPDVTVNYFYDALTPYGNWVNVDGYGTCWRPTAAVYDQGWQPYGNRGCWVNSDCGWYWQSDYAWGSTFHYGRWFRHPQYGWCWWPDTVWAPSWVTWRYTDDYCGWAPLPPYTIYSPGIGFLYRGNGISVGFDFGLGLDDFVFVSSGHFCDPHPRRFRCPPTEIGRVYGSSTIINNLNSRDHDGHHFVVNGGVPPVHFANNGAGPLRTVPINELQNPYNGHPGHNSGYNQSYQANNSGGQTQRGENHNIGQYGGHQAGPSNNGQPNAGWNSGRPSSVGQHPANNNYYNGQTSVNPGYSQPNQSYQHATGNQPYRGNPTPVVVGQQHESGYAQAHENYAPQPVRTYTPPPAPTPQPSYNPPPQQPHYEAPHNETPRYEAPRSAPAPSSSGGGNSGHNDQDKHH